MNRRTMSLKHMPNCVKTPWANEVEVTTETSRYDWLFDTLITIAKLAPFVAIAIIWCAT